MNVKKRRAIESFIDDVLRENLEVSLEEFKSVKRTRYISDCRCAVVHFLFGLGLSNPEIALFIGRERTTVYHHLRSVVFGTDLLETLQTEWAKRKASI